MAVMVDRAAPNSGLANLMNLQGVGVNPNSQLAYVPSKDLMTRYQTIPNPRTGIPQAVGVTGMAEGGAVSNAAAQVASYGRNGDTTLVHMTPREVQGLASLGQLTINPDTGLPEAFNLKSLLPIIGGIAGSILLPGAGTALGAGLGASAVGAGLGTAAGGLLSGQKPGEALLNGVLSGAMSWGIGSALGTGAEVAKTEPFMGAIGDVGSASIPAAQQGLAGQAGFTGLADFGSSAADMGLTSSQAVGGLSDYSGFVPSSVPSSAEYTVSPSKLSSKLFGTQPITTSEEGLAKAIIKTKASDPLTYAPLAAGALTGAFDEPYVPPEPEKRKPVETGYGSKRLIGGELITPPKTAAQIQEEMLYGGYTPRFTPYRYAASGGLVGLQAGGMPVVQQQPSAMQSAMAPQTMQQPVMMQQPQMQPQQQQQQMMAPLPQQQPQQASTFDPTSQFMKMMDLQEQVDNQKNQSALAGLLGTITSAASTGQQGGYNQPNGQMPQLPKALPTNYGSQVNLGLNEGGMPSREYFEGRVEGNGDGMSDGVEFEVDSEEIDGAMLSPDEYVLPADVVAMIGNGSSDAGADKLDMFIKSVRKESYGTEEQQKPYDDRGLAALVA